MKTAVNAGIYLFMQWLPTILLAMQVNLSKSLGYNLVIASGTLFSGIAGGLMGERVGRRRMILITSFLGTCSAVSFTWRSEEHTSELQSLMRISYAVFCLKKKMNLTKDH